MSFVHLHVHSQYSILDGLSSMKDLFARARELGMPAIALTDHGNLYGVKEFLKHGYDKSNLDENGKPIVKPILGCEVYVTRHYPANLRDAEHKGYYHLILLAKNYNGYKNLMKIVSEGHINGFYYKPRVTHEFIEKYSEGLICSSACLAGEIAKDIDAGDLDAARESVRWHKRVFGDDYYLEVMLHRTALTGLSPESYDKIWTVYEKQSKVNKAIFELASQEGVKVIATNDAHFVRKEDGPAHDHLICLTTNCNITDEKRLRYTQQEYIKSREEMEELFPDHPEALDNTLEVAAKCEAYKIDRPHVLPKYNIDPSFMKDIGSYLARYDYIISEGACDKDGNDRGEEFRHSVAYLCHLTFQGARQRYGDNLDEEHRSRIDFELKTICRMGFPDYFLIVQDYIRASRKMGYMVGPGRGSAAGSVVAYCLQITNLDPIRYQLLFERFLNPDRISMPDIDVDFENLPAAHKYVEDTYGADHVSRVITFGTMLAKGAIKNIARIYQVPIAESNRLAGYVPDRLQDDKTGEDVKVNLKNCYRLVPEFVNELENGTDTNRKVLEYAQKLEGCISNVSQHACATIIGRGNLTDFIPICLSEDKDTHQMVWTSQLDGHYIEDVGMLKMDFLGLNTLSIIHKTLDIIKERSGKEIDIEAIPIDDPETYELYGRGDTTIVFQFESPGMKKWLQKLHPSRFEDLIAMNALYRPGPMEYIPDFVRRKLGLESIVYDLPQMEDILKDTYGVTVYQEQVMLLSQKLAGFTKGEADKLRKAMGKKQIAILNELKDKFMAGGKANGHPEDILDKIWRDWEKFAQYAFNKSHATCYAWVSYQTGWLKCHYTPEFLAANLSCNLDNMEEIKKIIGECSSHNIKVMCPDVNESHFEFSVNRKGDIRFGLGGIKGFSAKLSEIIISVREEMGAYTDVWDFVEKISKYCSRLETPIPTGRKMFDCLIDSGAFDSFGLPREAYFSPCGNGELFVDNLATYSDYLKHDSMSSADSLFGEAEEIKPQRPAAPEKYVVIEPLETLEKEKAVVGMYFSAHPLDKYAFEIGQFANITLSELPSETIAAEEAGKPRQVCLAGMVTGCSPQTSKNGKQYLRLTLMDYSGNGELTLFGKDYERFGGLMQLHNSVLIDGEINCRFKGGRYELRISEVTLLGDVQSNRITSIKIFVDTAGITPDLSSRLKKVLKKHKGGSSVYINMSDSAVTGYNNLDFISTSFKVEVCADLVTELDAMGLKWEIGKKKPSQVQKNS